MKCRQYVVKQGDAYIAAGLSEADEDWLKFYRIKFEIVVHAVDVD